MFRILVVMGLIGCIISCQLDTKNDVIEANYDIIVNVPTEVDV